MSKLSLETAGVRIAADLDTVERLLNETLRATSQLQASMMNVRIDGDIAPYEGQTAVMRVQNVAAKLVEGQGEIARAHKSLRSDFVRMADVPDIIGRCPTSSLEAAEKVA